MTFECIFSKFKKYIRKIFLKLSLGRCKGHLVCPRWMRIAMSDTPLWTQVILSSSFAGAFFTFFGQLVVLVWNSRKEKKKLFEQHSHVYLNVAEELENFAKACNSRIYDINSCLEEMYETYSFEPFSRLAPRPTFNFPLMNDLPATFVAEMNNLKKEFENTCDWIREMSAYCDDDAAWDYEKEMLIFFGLKSCKISSKIRKNINVCCGITYNYYDNIFNLFQERYENYISGKDVNVIPVLEKAFEKKRNFLTRFQKFQWKNFFKIRT